MNDARNTTTAPAPPTTTTQINATIRTRSTLAAYANTVHHDVPIVADSNGFSDLTSGGRRFRYSHTELLTAPTGRVSERLVYDDVGQLSSRPPNDWLPPGKTPLGAGLRLSNQAMPAKAA